jgi:hypothetical protein
MVDLLRDHCRSKEAGFQGPEKQRRPAVVIGGPPREGKRSLKKEMYGELPKERRRFRSLRRRCRLSHSILIYACRARKVAGGSGEPEGWAENV